MSTLYIGILLLHSLTAVLWRQYSKVLGGLTGSSLLALTAAAIICSFSVAGIEVFLWTFNIAYSLFLLFVTVSLGSFSLHYKSLGSRRESNLWLAISLASAICASLSLASGMILWVVLGLSCMLFRLPWRTTATIAVVAVGFGTIWLHGYAMPAGHTAPSFSVHYAMDVLTYTAIYLGGPAVTAGASVPEIIGAIGLLLACILLVAGLSRKTATAFSLFLWAELLFLLASAFVTAVGRTHLGQAQGADSRYQIFSLQFWMALSLLLATTLLRAKQPAVVACAAFCSALGLCPYAHFELWMEPFVKQGLQLQNASSGLLSGVTDMENVAASHTGIHVLGPGLPYLHTRRLSIWADSGDAFVNSPISAIAHKTSSTRCEGTIDEQTFIDGLDSPGYRLHGVVWDRETNTSQERLLVVDEKGTIVGVGRGRQFRRLNNMFSIFGKPREWTAYAGMSSAGHIVTVQEIVGDTTCVVGKAELKPPYTQLPGRSPLLTQMEMLRPGVFRDGVWLVSPVNGDKLPGVERNFQFGEPGDIPVIGDWDGTGKIRIGVFRNGHWLEDVNGNRKWDGPGVDREATFGEPGDIPITGDWDGKGWLRIGVFRNGRWYLDLNGNGLWDGPSVDKEVIFGDRGDSPVVGPWNGSEILHIGIFRRGAWHVDADGRFASNGAQVYGFGEQNDIPVVANWGGRGPLRIGVFRHGIWHADVSGHNLWDGSNSEMVFGLPGDLPVVAPW